MGGKVIVERDGAVATVPLELFRTSMAMLEMPATFSIPAVGVADAGLEIVAYTAQRLV